MPWVFNQSTFSIVAVFVCVSFILLLVTFVSHKMKNSIFINGQSDHKMFYMLNVHFRFCRKLVTNMGIWIQKINSIVLCWMKCLNESVLLHCLLKSTLNDVILSVNIIRFWRAGGCFFWNNSANRYRHFPKNSNNFFNQSDNLMFNPIVRLFIGSFETNIRIRSKSH